jgi:hypothetical protein
VTSASGCFSPRSSPCKSARRAWLGEELHKLANHGGTIRVGRRELTPAFYQLGPCRRTTNESTTTPTTTKDHQSPDIKSFFPCEGWKTNWLRLAPSPPAWIRLFAFRSPTEMAEGPCTFLLLPSSPDCGGVILTSCPRGQQREGRCEAV